MQAEEYLEPGETIGASSKEGLERAVAAAKLSPETRRFVQLTYTMRWVEVYDDSVHRGLAPHKALQLVERGVAEGKMAMLPGNRRQRRAEGSRRRRKAKR